MRLVLKEIGGAEHTIFIAMNRMGLTDYRPHPVRAIMDALAGEDGNVSRAATALGISRPTLYRKMQAFGIARRTAVESFE